MERRWCCLSQDPAVAVLRLRGQLGVALFSGPSAAYPASAIAFEGVSIAVLSAGTLRVKLEEALCLLPRDCTPRRAAAERERERAQKAVMNITFMFHSL